MGLRRRLRWYRWAAANTLRSRGVRAMPTCTPRAATSPRGKRLLHNTHWIFLKPDASGIFCASFCDAVFDIMLYCCNSVTVLLFKAWVYFVVLTIGAMFWVHFKNTVLNYACILLYRFKAKRLWLTQPSINRYTASNKIFLAAFNSL